MTIKTTTRVLAAAVLLAMAAAMTAPAPADAGQYLFRAGSMEDPPSAAAPTNTVTGTNHKYATVDFSGTGTELCKIIHFMPFTDYTNGADFSVDLNYVMNGSSTNTFVTKMDVGCVGTNSACTGSGAPRACCSGSGTGNCDNYDTITLSSAGYNPTTPAAHAANAALQATFSLSGVFDETGCTKDTPIVGKICRDPAAVLDTNTDALKLITWRVRH